jgi:serine/threonine protein kinase
MTEPTDRPTRGIPPKATDPAEDETIVDGNWPDDGDNTIVTAAEPLALDEDATMVSAPIQEDDEATTIAPHIEEDDEATTIAPHIDEDDEATTVAPHIREDDGAQRPSTPGAAQGDATLALGEAPAPDNEPMSATKVARRSGRTTLLPGEVPENTLAPGQAENRRLSETATLAPDEHPEGNPQETRQAIKAQRATVIGKGNEGAAAKPAGESGERVVRDRFVILERLGKGGMGEVYKARDLMKVEAEDDNPYVAIKFLGDAFVQHPRALISLQREAKRSQQLAHPNVLTVYDFDRDGDRVYMTMEFLDGAPLSGWDSIKFLEGRQPTAYQLIEDMAKGLAYAHEHGVVHSDLKPDNVFVTVDGRIKILDFGIARIMDSALEKDSFDAGELGALTMRYASLEMLQGGKDPHPADDIYALGLMAYQLFSGIHPYEGKNAFEAMKLGIKAPPLKGLKSRERKAIERAIAFERADRTPSADVFLSEFTGRRGRNLALVAAVFVLTISSGYFAYEASLSAGPSIPFEELSIKDQQDFNINIDLGRQSSEIEDWDGASRYYMAAYDLHPRNRLAEEGLESLAQHLVGIAATLESPRQKQYLLTMLQGYSQNEYLDNHEALSAERKRLETELQAVD